MIAEYWCLYCLKCDAPVYDTIRVDKEKTARYSGGDPEALCTDPDAHRMFRTYCDMGEPECLSCSQFLGETPAVHPKARFSGDRAHIIPWSMTPDSRPENIIPLCHECHRVNPEDGDRRAYLDWLIARRVTKDRNLRKFLEEVKGKDFRSKYRHVLAGVDEEWGWFAVNQYALNESRAIAPDALSPFRDAAYFAREERVWKGLADGTLKFAEKAWEPSWSERNIKREDLEDEIHEAEKRGDFDTAKRLMGELNELDRLPATETIVRTVVQRADEMEAA